MANVIVLSSAEFDFQQCDFSATEDSRNCYKFFDNHLVLGFLVAFATIFA